MERWLALNIGGGTLQIPPWDSFGLSLSGWLRYAQDCTGPDVLFEHIEWVVQRDGRHDLGIPINEGLPVVSLPVCMFEKISLGSGWRLWVQFRDVYGPVVTVMQIIIHPPVEWEGGIGSTQGKVYCRSSSCLDMEVSGGACVKHDSRWGTRAPIRSTGIRGGGGSPPAPILTHRVRKQTIIKKDAMIKIKSYGPWWS